MHRGWNYRPLEQGRKNFNYDRSTLDSELARYLQRPHAPKSESEASRVLKLTFEIGERRQVFNDSVRLKESVEFTAG